MIKYVKKLQPMTHAAKMAAATMMAHAMAAMRHFCSTILLLAPLGPSNAFTTPKVSLIHGRWSKRIDTALSNDYLSSISGPAQRDMLILEPPPSFDDESMSKFTHAPVSYFSLDKLTPKGPRKNADVGEPHDSTRRLVTVGSTSVGSWWCAQGGWPSPAQRATTEIFYVFSGHGCVTDTDHTHHFFGPGDVVVLPKGWSGRWDIMEPIHKVWVVHDHPYIEETGNPIRAVITPYNNFAPQYLTPQGVRPDAIHGSAPSTASSTIYNVGPTRVGCWTCTPGSFPVVNRATTECFHVLEGTFFLTNSDGSARRCVAGDTVVLPKGWSGTWDVIETVKKLWVVVD